MIIAVDAGKYMTKALSSERTFGMRTRLSEHGPLLFSDAYAVEFDGDLYSVGDGQSDYDVSKTKLIHKLCTYVAIAKLTNEKEIDLVTGCPVNQFINKDAREEHAEYLKGSVQLKINTESFNFIIKSVMVLPETIGVVINNANDFIDTTVGVIDIGGLNTNGAIYERLKPIKSSVFTINQGGMILNAKIRRALNTAFMANYQDYEIPYVKAEGERKPIIDQVVSEHMANILEECKTYNWNIDELPIIFTGGGSLRFDVKRSRNPIWDNVKGFMKFKEMYK